MNCLWSHDPRIEPISILTHAKNTLERAHDKTCERFLGIVSEYVQSLEEYDTLLLDCILNIFIHRHGLIKMRSYRKLIDGSIVLPGTMSSTTIRVGVEQFLLSSFDPILVDRKVKFLTLNASNTIDLCAEAKCRAHFSDTIGTEITHFTPLFRDLAFLIADFVSGKYDIQGYMEDLAKNIYHRHVLKRQSDALTADHQSTIELE